MPCPVIDMKICSGCEEEKTYDFFVKSLGHKDGYHGVCKPCRNSQRRGKRSESPEQQRDYNLKRVYGLYQCDIDEIIKFQDNKCAICKGSGDENTHGTLYVDHCHETGEVRGMVCNQCNTMLGHSKDNIEVLAEAIKYLSGY